MKKLYILICCVTAITFSCSESFLEEELVSNVTGDYFNTPQGLDELLNGSYNGLRWRYTYEHGFCLTNYGVDEMTVGNGTDMIEYNDYNSNLMADESNKLNDEFWGVTSAWREIWYAIRSCNIGLDKIKTVTGEPFHTEELRLYAEAQFRFIRAFLYFDLVQQWGDIPLVTENFTDIQTEFPKSNEAEVFQQIIADLRAAIPNLEEVAPEVGRITKDAANHYLAKVYLTRASKVYRDWNTNYESDLDSAIYFSEEVINGPTYSLESNYASIFEFTGPNGPSESSPEIILSAQFTDNAIANERGNRMHLYVLTWYQDIPGLTREIPHGRPWRRLCPTDYAFDVFDRENDSRFYKSFGFSFAANDPSTLPDDGAGGNLFEIGDTAVVFVVNSEDEPIDRDEIDSWPYSAYVRYVRETDGSVVKEMPDDIKNHYAWIMKYHDPSRPDVNQQEGYRDGVLARVAETYLIAAEAYGLKGNYTQAMEYINVLRERAAYKDGEARHPLYYKIENNDHSNPSTLDDMLIANASELTSIPSDPVLASYFPPGASSAEDIFICHILNERSREMICELHRWCDLKRTGTLIERATLYNGSAMPIEGKHELRPFPQTFIDGLQVNGVPMSNAEKVAYQNPGY